MDKEKIVGALQAIAMATAIDGDFTRCRKMGPDGQPTVLTSELEAIKAMIEVELRERDDYYNKTNSSKPIC